MHEILRKTSEQLDDLGIFINTHHLSNDIDIHWHEFYEIEYITEGKGKAYINDKVYELIPNTLLFLSPVDFEKIEVEENLTVINLAFSNSVISPEMIFRLPNGCAMYDYPAAIFELLLQEAEIRDAWFYNKYTQLINSILIDIVREFSETTETMESSPVIKALHYMDLNFKNQINLEKISEYTGLTPTYFSTVFHKQMNTTFKDYLMSLRLEYAAKLLLISKFSSTEICYTSGFNDFSSFSRAFRKKFAISPSEYRNKNRSAKQQELK